MRQMPYIDETQINYIEQGETVDQEVVNRPTRSLLEQTKSGFEQMSEESIANSIVFAIALGG